MSPSWVLCKVTKYLWYWQTISCLLNEYPYIKEQGREVEYNVMINTYQVDKIKIDKTSSTFYIDYQNTNDPILFWFDINLGYGSLKNADIKIREKSSKEFNCIHRSPLNDSNFWKLIKEKTK